MTGAFFNADETAIKVYIAILRWVIPVLTALLLARCIKPLLTFRREPEIWAWLCLPGGKKLPITHWENVIGRSKRSDVVLDLSTVSRSHAVLTRYDDGSWSIADAESKGGVYVNGKKTRIRALQPEDVISIGGVEMTLQPISARQEQRLAELRTKASSLTTGLINVTLLTVIQVFCLLAYLLVGSVETAQSVLFGFGGIMVCQWLLLLFYVCIRRTSFELETIAFFLTTFGMCVICTVVPSEALKQLVSMVLGLVTFLAIGWFLRDLERAKMIRNVAAVVGVLLLVGTLLLGTTVNGAKNWLIIGPFSIQPSELSKLCFVFVGASAMNRIMTKKNLITFIAYSVLVCGCLALMNDFGGALIFFFAFLVIAYLRSGSVGTVALAITALVIAGMMMLRIAPHAVQRFTTWRHIWEDPTGAGWQQVRALMCMASGGWLGLGPGFGEMKWYPAAASDMVVATLSEEWGLVMMIMAVLCIVALAIFCVRSASIGRSSFYTIGACTAASILLIQTILNALGTVDVVPLTGVTFPFLSNGGSGMICAWGLLAFIKAADTRQNASFAVRLVRNGGDGEHE